MKRLVLVRHAKSSWKDPAATDFERPLNNRGKRDAPAMAERLAGRGLRPDLIVTSPAKRARKTAVIMARALGYPKSEIRRDRELYLAELETLVAVVSELEEEFSEVMLVGHNPGFTELTDYFTRGSIGNLPTSGMAGIEFSTERWREVRRGSGKLRFLDFPKKAEVDEQA